MIETNWFHMQKKVNGIEMGLTKGTQQDQMVSKIGVNKAEVPYPLQIWECPP